MYKSETQKESQVLAFSPSKILGEEYETENTSFPEELP